MHPYHFHGYHDGEVAFGQDSDDAKPRELCRATGVGTQVSAWPRVATHSVPKSESEQPGMDSKPEFNLKAHSPESSPELEYLTTVSTVQQYCNLIVVGYNVPLYSSRTGPSCSPSVCRPFLLCVVLV